MPPRYLTLAILAFWLAATGWLFHRDIRPRLRTGEPPPFSIDLADEARPNAPTRWTIYKDGEKKGYAQSSVRYRPEDDTYELRGEYKLWSTGRASHGEPDQVLRSMYRVSRDGELKEIEADVTVRHEIGLAIVGIKQSFQIEARLAGQVRDRQFVSRWRFKYKNPANPADETEFEMDAPTVAVSAHGNVLNPLQPLNRLTGIEPGQEWDLPMVDPLADAASASARAQLGDSLVKTLEGKNRQGLMLHARVLPQTQVLEWGTENVPCLVIDYKGDDVAARTWVRESDGLVLQQEVDKDGETLKLVREQ